MQNTAYLFRDIPYFLKLSFRVKSYTIAPFLWSSTCNFRARFALDNKVGGYRCRSQVPEHEILKIVRMYVPIITEFFDNEEEMAKFQKWREEYEEKERLEKEEKAKKKVGAA